jgi:putative flippase GtrA
VLGAQAANAVALLAATVANTAANRWWTFGVRGRVDAVRHHLQSLAVLGLTFVTTAAGLALLHAAAPAAGTVTKTATLAAANLVATAIRFVAMRHWIFRAR